MLCFGTPWRMRPLFDAHLACFNAWLCSRRMLPLCDRDHYFLARAAKIPRRLLNRKRDKSREVPPRQRMHARSRVKAMLPPPLPPPALPYVRIVPSHYSLGLLFKDVARTCLDIMLARARGSQSVASIGDSRGFYAPEKALTALRRAGK